jgi:carbamoyl-phosphate synthase large subunit
MKSVGETMAIGRTFASLQRVAFARHRIGWSRRNRGLSLGDDMGTAGRRGVHARPAAVVAQALRHGMPADEIYQACGIDPWFIARQEILDLEAKVRAHGLPGDAANLRMLKATGFSDARLSGLAKMPEVKVSALRKRLGVRPVFKRIDTCAAEFSSPTAYMYSTYAPPFGSAPACESRPTARKKIVVLGGGPNRIGQGIEFDYCCCHAASRCAGQLRNNHDQLQPETVSTVTTRRTGSISNP